MKRISTFQDRLKQFRDSKDYTLADMEKMTGIPLQTLNRYELNQRVPKINVVNDIAECFNLNPLWLQGYNVSMVATDSDTAKLQSRKIPILGSVACGEPIFAEETFEIFINQHKVVEADFALYAKGDSMINARILDGDIVFIKLQADVNNGEIAVVLVYDSAALKRVYKYPNRLELRPENPTFPVQNYEGEELNYIRILGKAVAFQSGIK